jgi:hypothetical protein
VDKDQPQIERANEMDGSGRGTVLTRVAHLVSILAVNVHPHLCDIGTQMITPNHTQFNSFKILIDISL